ncbi:MAG: mucoidy inhibitor MuiA family protein [Myxococcota bacterium]
MSEPKLSITTVTVLEDRALVQRVARVRLDAGATTLRVEGVSPVLVDKTLCVALDDPSARVMQARVHRQQAATEASQTARVQGLMQTVRTRQLAVEQAKADTVVARERVEALARIEALALEEVSADLALGRDVADALEALVSVREQLGEAADAVAQADRAEIRAIRACRDAEETLAEHDAQTRTLQAVLELSVHNAGEAADVEVDVRYVVAGALWRPSHVASLKEGDESTVHVETRACVWQATGEDWSDVELRVSTERPSLGSSPPQLVTDALSLRPKRATVDVATRDQSIATTGEGVDPQVRDEMPGVDDGGTALLLTAEGTVSIPSDGRPHHVSLFSFTAPTALQWVCRPERVAAVLGRTEQTHRGPKPLLAGPVELRRNGGYVGRTSTLFVAPGETFELGWGPLSELRVHRRVTFPEPTRKPLSSWTRKPRVIELKFSNLGPTPRTVALQERVMVSEVEKVEVEHDDLGGGSIDDHGIVTRDVAVRGFGTAAVTLRWTLLVHDDVTGI